MPSVRPWLHLSSVLHHCFMHTCITVSMLGVRRALVGIYPHFHSYIMYMRGLSFYPCNTRLICLSIHFMCTQCLSIHSVCTQCLFIHSIRTRCLSIHSLYAGRLSIQSCTLAVFLSAHTCTGCLSIQSMVHRLSFYPHTHALAVFLSSQWCIDCLSIHT